MRDGAGELVSMPAEWTDAVPGDPFLIVAGVRAPFHLEGLVALSELVAVLAAGGDVRRGPGRSCRLACCQADYAGNVTGILPLTG